MANKLKNIVVAADGTITGGIQEETSLIDTALDIGLAPVRAFSSDDTTYYSGSTLGLASLSWGAAGLFIGEAWGNRRGRDRKKSFLPFFRG